MKPSVITLGNRWRRKGGETYATAELQWKPECRPSGERTEPFIEIRSYLDIGTIVITSGKRTLTGCLSVCTPIHRKVFACVQVSGALANLDRPMLSPLMSTGGTDLSWSHPQKPLTLRFTCGLVTANGRIQGRGEQSGAHPTTRRIKRQFLRDWEPRRSRNPSQAQPSESFP